MCRKKVFSLAVTAAAAVGILAVNVSAQVTTFYDMSTNLTASTGSTFSAGQGSSLHNIFHITGGTVTVVEVGGSKALRLTGRTENWNSIDVKREGMRVDGQYISGKYTIHVTGHIPADATVPADAHVTINRSEDPWSELAVQSVTSASRNFDLKYEPFEMTGSTFGNLGYDFRIQTRNAQTMPYVITSLIVKVERVEGNIFEWPTPKWDNDIASIKDKFASAFKIGNIMSPGNTVNRLNSPYACTTFFKKHYNVVTLENHMKPSYTMPQNGTTGFAAADSVVNWANRNNIDVIGHTLVWHSQSPDWLNGGQKKTPLPRAQAKKNMEDFIKAVAGHYKNKVTTWDVVNEAFMNIGECLEEKNDWRDALRSSPCHRASLNLNVNDHTSDQLSPWYDAYANGAAAGESGADYLYDAFVFTRLADPNAKLYYNDFNEEFPLKREAIALMTEDLNKQWKEDSRNTEPDRLLIEGIGMQSHYFGGRATPIETSTYDLAKVDSTIQRFAKTGARISITELDIPMGGWSSADRYNAVKLSDEEERIQAKQYADLMRTYLKYAEHIDRITFWGMSDGPSWRNYGMPLLFDNSLRPKAAYDSIMAINVSSSIWPSNRAKTGRTGASLSLVTIKGRALFVGGDPSSKVRVRVVNMAGKTVARYNVKGGTDILLRKVPSGVYVIEARRAKDGVKDSARVTLK